MQLTEEQLLAAYKRMRDIREFEDRLHEENTNGDIPGFIHLYSGEALLHKAFEGKVFLSC